MAAAHAGLSRGYLTVTGARCTLWIAYVLSIFAGGCQTLDRLTDTVTKPRVELPPAPEQSVYRDGHWEIEPAPPPGTLRGDFASARVLFQQAQYDRAEKVFRWLCKRAEREKDLDTVEDCLFWEAEAQYAQRKYPAARATYQKLLENFPTTRYRAEAVQRQFDIADYWLNETREDMLAWDEYRQGKRGLPLPKLVHFDRDKPLLDLEGHAIKACEAVYTQDPTGPLADRALFLAGGTSFYRENYLDADTYYSLLVEQFPRSPLAPHALELAIQSKIQLTGGPDYDGRKLAEARQLIDTALRTYPELRDRQSFLESTLLRIHDQQAEKDFRIAEYYRRTGHYGSAYFYYEIVRRRYPGTTWADRATERMLHIREKIEAGAEPSLVARWWQRIRSRWTDQSGLPTVSGSDVVPAPEKPLAPIP
ncbi:MAG: hypothetical protein C4297_04780 [Gemmataceae bacterium]